MFAMTAAGIREHITERGQAEKRMPRRATSALKFNQKKYI
jgi:hypothetical protein